jgi:hypothetical protein
MKKEYDKILKIFIVEGLITQLIKRGVSIFELKFDLNCIQLCNMFSNNLYFKDLIKKDENSCNEIPYDDSLKMKESMELLLEEIRLEMRDFLVKELSLTFIQFAYLNINYIDKELLLQKEKPDLSEKNIIAINLMIGAKAIMGEIGLLQSLLKIKFVNEYACDIKIQNVTKLFILKICEDNYIKGNKHIKWPWFNSTTWNKDAIWVLSSHMDNKLFKYSFPGPIIGDLQCLSDKLSVLLFNEYERLFESNKLNLGDPIINYIGGSFRNCETMENNPMIQLNRVERFEEHATAKAIINRLPSIVAYSFTNSTLSAEMLLGLLKITLYINWKYFIIKYEPRKSVPQVLESGLSEMFPNDNTNYHNLMPLVSFSEEELGQFFMNNDFIFDIWSNSKKEFIDDLFYKMRETISETYVDHVTILKLDKLLILFGDKLKKKLISNNCNIQLLLPVRLKNSFFDKIIANLKARF